MEAVSRCLNVDHLINNFEYYVNMSISQKGRMRVKGIWRHMMYRCENHNSYTHVNVCQDWLYNFDNFYNWSISNGYSDDLTIDRIDNNSGYCPNNCRWVPKSFNNTYKGEFSRPEIGY